MYVCKGGGGGVSQKNFSARSKNKGGGDRAPQARPLDPSLHNHFSINKSSRLILDSVHTIASQKECTTRLTSPQKLEK